MADGCVNLLAELMTAFCTPKPRSTGNLFGQMQQVGTKVRNSWVKKMISVMLSGGNYNYLRPEVAPPNGGRGKIQPSPPLHRALLLPRNCDEAVAGHGQESGQENFQALSGGVHRDSILLLWNGRGLGVKIVFYRHRQTSRRGRRTVLDFSELPPWSKHIAGTSRAGKNIQILGNTV